MQQLRRRHGGGPDGGRQDRRRRQRPVRFLVARAALPGLSRRPAHPDRIRQRAHRFAHHGPAGADRPVGAGLQPARAKLELPGAVAGRGVAPARHHRLPGDRLGVPPLPGGRAPRGPARATSTASGSGPSPGRSRTRSSSRQSSATPARRASCWRRSPSGRWRSNAPARPSRPAARVSRRQPRDPPGAALRLLRQDAAGTAELSRPPAVSGRSAEASLRRYRANAAAVDGCRRWTWFRPPFQRRLEPAAQFRPAAAASGCACRRRHRHLARASTASGSPARPSGAIPRPAIFISSTDRQQT